MTLSGHSNRLTAAVFSPDDTQIATASRDGTIRLWETATGQLLGVLQGAGALKSILWNTLRMVDTYWQL